MTATEMTMTTEAEVGREAPLAAAAVEIATDSPTNLQRRVSTGLRRRKVVMETEIGTGVTGRETAAVRLTRAPRRSPGVTRMTLRNRSVNFRFVSQEPQEEVQASLG